MNNSTSSFVLQRSTSLTGTGLGGIDTNFDSTTFGKITNPQVTVNPREIQLGLKLYF